MKVKTHSKKPQRPLDVRFYHIYIYTLLLFNKHECQETKMKNPFDSILGFGSVNDFWKWNFQSLKNDIFTKDIQRTHIIK
jgi:hypothetical protein